jgi:hypothetical protein
LQCQLRTQRRGLLLQELCSQQQQEPLLPHHRLLASVSGRGSLNNEQHGQQQQQQQQIQWHSSMQRLHHGMPMSAARQWQQQSGISSISSACSTLPMASASTGLHRQLAARWPSSMTQVSGGGDQHDCMGAASACVQPVTGRGHCADLHCIRCPLPAAAVQDTYYVANNRHGQAAQTMAGTGHSLAATRSHAARHVQDSASIHRIPPSLIPPL